MQALGWIAIAWGASMLIRWLRAGRQRLLFTAFYGAGLTVVGVGLIISEGNSLARQVLLGLGLFLIIVAGHLMQRFAREH